MCVSAERAEVLDPWGLQMVVRRLKWVLKTTLESHGRATHPLSSQQCALGTALNTTEWTKAKDLAQCTHSVTAVIHGRSSFL